MHRRANIRLLATALCLLLLGLGLPGPTARATSSCGNPIACENALPGTPQSVWDDGTDDQTILGYATQMSVNIGSPIDFKVNTDAAAYTIDIYRLGYYQGNGARKITSVPVSVPLPQTQPPCLRDIATDLYDCGTWGVSATWDVPTTAVSGVYIADLVRADTGARSHIVFVVRDDASHAGVVFQTSDTTWQAYNTYGGASFYVGVNHSRGYKVSYNRPFVDRDTGTTMRDYVYANEYPTIRYLESNGIDTSYISGVDVAMGQGHLTNHKVFLSVGHDEYWSSSQRDSVTQARDAGVNLMFLSGNEVYWHTRWESSIDGSGTPFRTIVCYKDTREPSQIDPVSPTPTWRDARYAGFTPENSLTGTMYVGQGANLPIQVTSDQGKLRLWRNTSLASLADGTTGSVGTDLLGYEMDGIVDNGFAPAGQIAASTTVADIPEILRDFGLTTNPGTLTHHFSEYRAASGALVFSAGSIQYGWGLDGAHDLSTHGAVPDIQQLTINLLGDMGVQATTLQGGLVAASASSDHTAPVVTIAQPTSGTLAFGSRVTVSGTATDAGGVVAGVEVSVDGGRTWHPATGTASWTYTGAVLTYSTTAIQVRATDDSLNTSDPVSVPSTTVTGANTLFGDTLPDTPDSGDTAPTTLGMVFTPNADGYVSAVRFFKSAANTGTHTGTLFASDGTVLATGSFTNETATGWQQLTFDTLVPVFAGTRYVVAYYAPLGHYAAASYFFAPGPYTTEALTAIGGLGVANGVFGTGSSFPTSSFHQTNYWVDVAYSLASASPLTASAVSPVVGAGSVLTTSTVVGRFNKDPGNTSYALAVTQNGIPVPGATSYDGATHQLTFAPTQPLAYASTFTAAISDPGLSAPYSWTFTTVDPPRVAGQCPCTLFQDTDQPATATTDPTDLTVGVAFAPTLSGTVTAIRYWKPLGVAGTHTVSLYGPTRILLGTATASSETSVGWQTATFASPVTVSAGTTYTASVRFPLGGYPYAYGFYAAPQSVGPLTTPTDAGRYGYGAVLPDNAVSTTYYVDPVFVHIPSVPPVVTSASPGNGARSVPVSGSVTVTFNEAISAGTAAVTLTGPSGAVPGAVTSTATTRTFTPTSALAQNTAYVLNVSGAVTDDGVAQTQAYTETFTTSGPTACPCSLLETTLAPQLPDVTNDGGITLGLKLTPTVDGYITGLRYWRAASNTGTHTGKLYAANGSVLGTLTFVDGAPGWQEASFASPVAVSAGTPYVATYYSPNGTYSATTGAFTTTMSNPPLASVDPGSGFASGDKFPDQSFGGTNYFIDVVLIATPSVSLVTPASGASGVAVTSPVTLTFSGSLDPASVSVTVTGPGSTVVPGALDVAAPTATFTPSAALAGNTTFTVTVTASAPGGIPMTPFTSTFTTIPPAPVVASRSPAVNATSVAANATVQVTFTQEVDPAKSTLSLVNASGVPVPGALSTTTTTVTFTPSALLAANIRYTATVGATSPLGIAMAPSVWSFTVETAPTVTAVTPANLAVDVPNLTTVGATFSKAVNPSSIGITVTDANNVVVSGTLATTSTSGTFTPSALLTPGMAYRVTVSASLSDGLGSTPFVSGFTTAATVNILPALLTPKLFTTSPTALTVGVKLRSTAAYSVTAVKLYLPTSSTGTYTATLWSSTGTKLATVTGPPSSIVGGWRTFTLAAPVRIAADTTYVATVRTTQYASTSSAFKTPFTNGTFSVPASGAVTSSADVFPTASSTTNYFVDVVAEP